MSLLSLDVFWKLGMFSKNGLWVPPEDLAHPSEFGWNGTLYFTVGLLFSGLEVLLPSSTSQSGQGQKQG